MIDGHPHSPQRADVLHRLRSTRQIWLTLCAAAVLLRLIVPAGWMPVADAGGIHIGICTDSGVDPTGFAARAQAAFDERLGKKPLKHHAPAQPCVFAALGMAAAGPAFAPLLSPPPLAAGATPQPLRDTTPGRGLAAPPPPATGPPAFA